MKKIGFIGCGNMGGALAQAVAKASTGAELLLCDSAQDKVAALSSVTGGVSADLLTLAETADVIFLGVKPQGLAGLFEILAPILKKRKDEFLLISMAAGISMSYICELAGRDCSVIRIMPNTPVAVGEGMILYDANNAVTKVQESDFLSMLEKAGKLDRLNEASIDAASALSGCGPAFVYLFAEGLADGAVECGLPRQKANLYAAQTLLGAATLLLESGKHPGELKDAVCSPGGTTIAGVHALETGAFRADASSAVLAAYKKTLELKK